MVISVISGKGGSGKTLFSISLAYALNRSVELIDADTEEPNLINFFKARFIGKSPVKRDIPVVSTEKCDLCRACVSACQYNALAILKRKILIFPNLCRSCGLCAYICHTNAISYKPRVMGNIKENKSEYFHIKSGVLNIGEEYSYPIINAIKNNYTEETVIIDGPPGIVLLFETVYRTDYTVIVTEATITGLEDLRRVKKSLDMMDGILYGLVLNKYTNSDISIEIEEYCKKEGIEILMKIPYSTRIMKLTANGNIFIDEFPEYYAKFRNLYTRIVKAHLRRTL